MNSEKLLEGVCIREEEIMIRTINGFITPNHKMEVIHWLEPK